MGRGAGDGDSQARHGVGVAGALTAWRDGENTVGVWLVKGRLGEGFRYTPLSTPGAVSHSPWGDE